MSQKSDALIAMLPPPPDIASWAHRTDPLGVAYRSFHPTRILVVGLASPAVVSIAASYPEAEIVGLDGDPEPVEILGEVCRDLHLGNLSLVRADLDDTDDLSSSFDWIHVPDPLQSTGDEGAAWRALAHRLALDGLLTLRMRSRRQEYWGDEFREALAILVGFELPVDLDTWMALGCRFAGDLASGAARLSPAARQVNAQLLHAPALTSALTLLPAGQSHTLDSAQALLAHAGLVMLGFLNQPEWESRGILADPEILTLEEGLTLEERHEMADILRAPDLLLVCGPQRDRERSLPR
jgi:hypothetical protein